MIFLQAVKDIDSWYDDMKSLQPAESKPSPSQPLGSMYIGCSGFYQLVPLISFHYVAEVESDILYRVFKMKSMEPPPYIIPTVEIERLLMSTNRSYQGTQPRAVDSKRLRNTLAEPGEEENEEQIHKDNIKAIFKHWPFKGLGGYGRKVKSLREASLLYDLIFRKIYVHNTYNSLYL